jgi:hypothetical protein
MQLQDSGLSLYQASRSQHDRLKLPVVELGHGTGQAAPRGRPAAQLPRRGVTVSVNS